MDDHAQLLPQDPQTFAAILDSRPGDRRRLQELGDQIPSLDGCGEDLRQAKAAVESALAVLHAAQREAQAAAVSYALRAKLLTEERQTLERLGLTCNLYRRHKPYDPVED